MITLTWLSRAKKFGLGITSPAHALIALLVSIQLVSRIHGTMARRSKCHKGLATMYVGQYYDNILTVKTKLQKELCWPISLHPSTRRCHESREIIQKMLVLSRKQRNTCMKSKEWRMEVAYRVLMMLRTSMAVLQFPSLGINAWEVPELNGQELLSCTPSPSWRRNAQVPPTNYTDSRKVPFLMAYLLRETLVSQEERLPHPMTSSQQEMLLTSVDSFLKAYYGWVPKRGEISLTIWFHWMTYFQSLRLQSGECPSTKTLHCLIDPFPFLLLKHLCCCRCCSS